METLLLERRNVLPVAMDYFFRSCCDVSNDAAVPSVGEMPSCAMCDVPLSNLERINHPAH
jgi:hypothetical protein